VVRSQMRLGRLIQCLVPAGPQSRRAWIWVYYGFVICLKSMLTGLSSLIALGILFLFVIGIIGNIQAPPGTQVGFDSVSVVRSSPLVWILAILAFTLGFYWKYRRLKLRQAK